jgi:hypothetical protein
MFSATEELAHLLTQLAERPARPSDPIQLGFERIQIQISPER